MKRKRLQLQDAILAAVADMASAEVASPEWRDAYYRVETAHDRLTEYGVTESLDGPGSYVIGSPETSPLAASLARTVAKACRRDILNEIRTMPGGWNTNRPDVSGLTCKELEARLRKEHETVSSAVNWLMNAGWLRDSGYRRANPSGRMAVVWCLTDAALGQMRSPEWVAQHGRESA